MTAAQGGRLMENHMKDEEKAREIAREVIVGHVGSLHPAVEPIAAALTAARAEGFREALEEAAKVVQSRVEAMDDAMTRYAAENDSGMYHYAKAQREAHRHDDAAIRALLPQQGQQQRPYDDTFSAWDAVTAEIARRAGGGDRG